jgi:hypothetical protein
LELSDHQTSTRTVIELYRGADTLKDRVTRNKSTQPHLHLVRKLLAVLTAQQTKMLHFWTEKGSTLPSATNGIFRRWNYLDASCHVAVFAMKLLDSVHKTVKKNLPEYKYTDLTIREP